LLSQLHDRKQIRFGHRAKMVGPKTCEKQLASMSQVRQPIDEYGVDEPVLASEVVLHHGVIGHPCFDTDLSKGDAINSVDSEQTLRRKNDDLLGGRPE